MYMLYYLRFLCFLDYRALKFRMTIHSDMNDKFNNSFTRSIEKALIIQLLEKWKSRIPKVVFECRCKNPKQSMTSMETRYPGNKYRRNTEYKDHFCLQLFFFKCVLTSRRNILPMTDKSSRNQIKESFVDEYNKIQDPWVRSKFITLVTSTLRNNHCTFNPDFAPQCLTCIECVFQSGNWLNLFHMDWEDPIL